MKNRESIEVLKQIDAYIRGKLSKREIDELWLQFLKNPYYYELFETELHLRNLIQKGRHADSIITRKKGRKLSVKYWVMAAAATVIVVLTIQFFLAESTPDLEALALHSISYNEMAAGNIERSDDEHTITVEADMNRAMAAAYMFNEDESIEMFSELKSLAVKESQRVRIEYNMAILYYNRSQFELARDLFHTVTNSDIIDDVYRERAWWFMANTHLKMKNQGEAMEAIQKVLLLDGHNRKSASALLNVLNRRG